MDTSKFRYVWIGHFPANAITERYTRFVKYLESNPDKARIGLGWGAQVDRVQPPPLAKKEISDVALGNVTLNLDYVDDTLKHGSKSIFDRSVAFESVVAAKEWMDSEAGQIWSTGADNCVLMSLAGSEPGRP